MLGKELHHVTTVYSASVGTKSPRRTNQKLDDSLKTLRGRDVVRNLR